MNKKKILAFIIVVFCLFSVTNVYADTRDCDPFSISDAEKNLTQAKLHFENKQAYAAGEKVYIDISGVERDNTIDIAVLLRSTNAGNRKYYMAYLKNILGNEDSGAYFIAPDDPERFPQDEYEIYGYVYYKKTNEIKDYGVTPDGEKTPIYKNLCTSYFTKKDEVSNENDMFLENSYGKFVLTAKKPEARNILSSIKTEKDYTYFGGKINFTVTTTEPIKNAYLTFVDRTKQGNLPFFTVNLISDGSGNEFTYSVNAPTYGINNVYEGTYKLEEIIFYDTNGNKLTYNTNKEKAAEYNDKYVEYDLSLFIGKPITDLIKEAEFELKGMKLVKNEVKVGDKVGVDFEWYYNSPKLKFQSVMLTFSDDSGNNVFSTYLKELQRDSSIIIPSNAKEGKYTLKTVTITFDSYVGETNTIILDKDNATEKSIFNQQLVIIENKDAGLYFLAEELYETSYEKIKNAKDNTVITINANEKSILPASLFDAIKESSKQLVIEYGKNEWVFNGVDIEDTKPIDVSMEFYNIDKLESDETIKKALGDKTVVLEFPENGNLPGKALIRIKDDEAVSKPEGNVYYIYHIDEKENKLNKVAIEIQKSSDGYLEFYINHNSKYAITTNMVKDDSILGEDDTVAKINTTVGAKGNDSKSSDNTPLYIALCIALVIIIILVIIIVRKPKKVEIDSVAKDDIEPKEEPKTEPKEEKNE